MFPIDKSSEVCTPWHRACERNPRVVPEPAAGRGTAAQAPGRSASSGYSTAFRVGFTVYACVERRTVPY